MATSNFWHNLGVEFGIVKAAMQANSGAQLKAIWTSDHSMTPPMEHLNLWANDPRLELQFKVIAKRGGDALSPDDNIDPLYVWLGALVREARKTHVSPKYYNASGFELDKPVDASINLCALMESDMLTVERLRRYVDAKRRKQTSPPPVPVPPPPIPVPEPDTPRPSPVGIRRQSGAIVNLHAARRTAYYITRKGLRQADFAKRSKISERTLRSFLKTGKLRKSSLVDLCNAMKTNEESLLSDIPETGN